MGASAICAIIFAGIAILFLIDEDDDMQEASNTMLLGSTENAELIYDNVHTKTPKNKIKREDSLHIEAVEDDDVICFISMELLEGKGKGFVQKGGIGFKSAIIVLRSAWNAGFRFRIIKAISNITLNNKIGLYPHNFKDYYLDIGYNKRIEDKWITNKVRAHLRSKNGILWGMFRMEIIMAPVKFGLFRARSREQAEQPSTENLLQNSGCHETDAQTPGSPLPSTSKGFEPSDLQLQHLNLDSDDEETISERPHRRRISNCSKETEDAQVNYLILKDASTDGTSVSTLNEDGYEEIQETDPSDETQILEQVADDASTTADVNSLKFDGASLAPSEDLSVNCGPLKKVKKTYQELREVKDFREMARDSDMWRASNIEVMENLLNRSGSLDDQYKWEAIATARGLCTLTDSCTCRDCRRNKYLAESAMSDGDGGLGAAAPMYTAMSIGLCSLQ